MILYEVGGLMTERQRNNLWFALLEMAIVLLTADMMTIRHTLALGAGLTMLGCIIDEICDTIRLRRR